jgi:hypothetical protein
MDSIETNQNKFMVICPASLNLFPVPPYNSTKLGIFSLRAHKPHILQTQQSFYHISVLLLRTDSGHRFVENRPFLGCDSGLIPFSFQSSLQGVGSQLRRDGWVAISKTVLAEIDSGD